MKGKPLAGLGWSSSLVVLVDLSVGDLRSGEKTRRERLKSALYLRLKKRKTFFWKKT